LRRKNWRVFVKHVSKIRQLTTFRPRIDGHRSVSVLFALLLE
jgi:hypothetical protein